ncbi:MAG: peptidoglycan DD-metalloendopeptidase family protein [Sarcina sp.]
MDKKQRFKNFIKKEGFYVILIACICLVATVAAFTAKNDANKEEISSIENEGIVENDKSTMEFEDAELVEEDKEKNEEKESEEKEDASEQKDTNNEAKNKEETVQVSTTPKKEFINPVKDGKVTRSYNVQPRIENEGKTASVYKGVDIEASVGTDVKAIADGKVVDARQGDSKEGFFVKIEHTNGVVSIYANLDKDLKVKIGDKVTQGTVVGKVGNTVKTSPQDRVSSEFLLFHVEKSNEPIDPQKLLNDLQAKQ